MKPLTDSQIIGILMCSSEFIAHCIGVVTEGKPNTFGIPVPLDYVDPNNPLDRESYRKFLLAVAEYAVKRLKGE